MCWSFEQLSKEGIKSDDLARWNAPVNTIDEYENYFLGHNDELRHSCFCNCTDQMHFGELCQYTFDLMSESFETLLSSHFSNLQSIPIDEAVMMEDADVTCYKRDPLCNGGCFDWRQICNGIIDCHNGEDEASCHLLEFNKCRIDEYRCRSGHCIPIMFAFDTIYDCIDGSDEIDSNDLTARLIHCYLDIPHMFCDDHNEAWMVYPCGDGNIVDNPQVGCDNQRHIRTLKNLYATSNITLCWQYILCAQYFDFLFPFLVNCSELCADNNDCLPMVSMVCPDRIVFFPPNPVMLSPTVYLAYQTNKDGNHFLPDYICYTQCDHLFPPSLRLHGYSCRSFLEFTTEPFYIPKRFGDMFNSIYHLFAGCMDSITRNSSSSTVFFCPLTNRALSFHRIKNGYEDCYLSFDETFDGNVCALNLTQRFQCWTDPTICIPLRRVHDGAKDCPDRSDEVYSQSCIDGTEQICNYKRGIDQLPNSYYRFKDLCDGEEFKPSLYLLHNGTDETDCENAWCQLVPSTLCDGYWHCSDGRDELNCSSRSPAYYARAVIPLRNLNGCSASEHFCLPISNTSENISRLCLAVSRAGDGNIDCWGAADERTKFCNYTKIITDRLESYPCASTDNICIRPFDICNGHADCPLQDDEKVCNWRSTTADKHLFFCRNGTILAEHARCNGQLDCANGEDEWLCDLMLRHTNNIPRRFHTNMYDFPVYPMVLSNISAADARNFSKVFSISTATESDWYCNRGMPVKDIQQRRCLCPPSYIGERCEIQRDRVSIILQIILSASLQHISAHKFILYSIHTVSSEILAEEEILHIPYIHSLYKHLSLLPSVHANTSFVRIDAYEVDTQRIIAYRTSWKFNLPFSFLPVRRLAVRLILPDEISFTSRIRSKCHSCLHGECLSYQNSDDVFCRCHNGWVGANCNITFRCAPNALTLSSHRCLCPLGRYGARCFVPNIVECQCQNGGTCIALDARIKQSACLCSDNFFGKYCERIQANLTIKLNTVYHPESLPIVLVQFVTVRTSDEVYFENVFLFERVSTRNLLVVHHVDYEELPLIVLCKIFYNSSINHYVYYLVLYVPPISVTGKSNPKSVLTQLEDKQKCLHVREMEIFKSPVDILTYPHIKRIKFYLRACIDNKTRCFHDEVYLCLCADQTSTIPIPSCIIYDHTRETCKESSYCLNGGLWIENRRKNILQYSCLCSECHHYGPLCQFSIGQQGLSLDALVGLELRTGKPISEQSMLIKLYLIIIISMIMIGFVGNLLSTITFSRKKSRETGCGWYLFLMSISNQCALIVFGLRFVYLLVTQMVVWDNRTRSLILCQCLEVALTVLWNLSNWLSACVSVERTLTVVCGASFNKSLSIRCAKCLCGILPLVLMGMAVHEPMTRRLIEDPRLGRYTWCVTKFDSATIKTVATVFSIFHLVGPFLINLTATGILILTISRQKFTVRKETVHKTFTVVLREQIAYYKHLITSPVLLLILALLRLIISLASLCIDTSWRNYIFLAGYFISFAPLMATLFIFIFPAPIYRDELKLYILQFRRFLFCQLSRKRSTKNRAQLT